MAYDRLLDAPAESLIEKLVSTGIIESEVFTLQMCRTTGLLWFGGYDSDYFIGNLSYAPILTSSDNSGVYDYYNVDFTGFKINGVSINVSPSAFVRAPVDSGTTAIQLSDEIYQALVQALLNNNFFKTQFPGSGGNNYFEVGLCVEPQTTTFTTAHLNSQLPTITVVLNGLELTLQAISSYLYEAEFNGHLLYCPGISPGGTGPQSNILGWAFMNQFVTFFDRVSQTIGFAPTYACGATWKTPNTVCVDQYDTVIANSYCLPYNGTQTPPSSTGSSESSDGSTATNSSPTKSGEKLSFSLFVFALCFLVLAL